MGKREDIHRESTNICLVSEDYRSGEDGRVITYVVTSLLLSPARVLVNTVNTVGVMGKGIARDFKRIYPDMFKRYQKICDSKQLSIGQLWLYKTPHKWILNFPTKTHWRQPSRPEYIEAGLRKFALTYMEKNISSVSFPMLGCGNGGLDWETQVKPLMELYLNKLPIDIFVHLSRSPLSTPEHMDIEAIKAWLRSEPESLPFAEVWEDLRELLSHRTHFFTLGLGQPFMAYETEHGVVLETTDGTLEVHHEQLFDLWQHLPYWDCCGTFHI